MFLGIATGGTGGTYYPLGGMLAQLLSNTVDLDGKKLAQSAAYIGRFRRDLVFVEKAALTLGGLLLVLNDLRAILVGAVIVGAILGLNWFRKPSLATS